MSSLETYQIILFIFEMLGFILNVLTLYVISLLQLKEIDMWLGTIMAVCDLLLTGFEILGTIINMATGEEAVFSEESHEIILSGLLIFLILNSMTCVLYLGLVRWLVICKNYELTQLKKWTIVYFFDTLMSGILVSGCIATDGFRKVDVKKYYYPGFSHINTWSTVLRIFIICHLLCCFVVVNYCYASIAWNYLRKLNGHSNSYNQEDDFFFKREKKKILMKIGSMLLLYNLSILPFCLVDFVELVTVQKRSQSLGKFAFSSIVVIAFINPAMLTTMHCDTWNRIRKLFQFSACQKGIPFSVEPNTSILSDYDSQAPSRSSV